MTRTLAHTSTLFAIVLLISGCEGWDRSTDARIKLDEPPAEAAGRAYETDGHIADELERMAELREEYLGQLLHLERMYMDRADLPRANWARRQRALTEAVEVYPYAGKGVREQELEVRPERRIAQADEMYNEAMSIMSSFDTVPLAGALPANKQKARDALDLLRAMIMNYPKSDKVDDAAFEIAEIYKEYLREDDPDNLLALRYYRWSWELDPRTPHPARFQSAVVYDHRMHDRIRALELYKEVIRLNEYGHSTNATYSAQRIDELTDDENSPIRPREPIAPTGVASDDPSRVNDDPGSRLEGANP
jgi:hypothetical protein